MTWNHWTITPVIILISVAALATAGTVVIAAEDEAEPIEVDADAMLMEVTVGENGDAMWRIDHRIRFESDEDAEAFDELKAEIEADPTRYEERYKERMDGAAIAAAEKTHRPMSIENMTVTAEKVELPERWGVVRYEFEWTYFSVADGNSITIGDAISGLFLDERMVLSIQWPDGYSVEAISPAPNEERSNVAVWRGPLDFGSDEPELLVSTGGSSSVDRGAITFILLGFVVLLVIGWFIYQNGLFPIGSTSEVDRDRTDAVDRALLSNEEQVVHLLESHGGRMKQKQVADELGWTAAKTSQVTGDLRDAGRIEGFRIGRENVLKLPDAEDEIEASD